ncbi:MAG: phosphoribosylaminoimidazolesuccinocarboxamide synthase [Spirochaetaceae bacterium]
MNDPYGAKAFEGFSNGDLPGGATFTQGKVRDVFEVGDKLLIYTSDRISAFDRVLGLVPHKGEILNALSLYWFRHTSDIVPNHIIKSITPRSVLVKKCVVFPVEVVVRGYLTGSAWRDYSAGRPVSGIELPKGMRMNERLEKPLVTPSTKAERGTHDAPISAEEVVARGLATAEQWETMRTVALSLYARGSEICAHRGLILVDTKYEFGLLDGRIHLIDELHTPDSSRFWYADSYEELFARGEKQRKIDKEYFRQWLMEQGFSGDGTPPKIPDEILREVSKRYVRAYETIIGKSFAPKSKNFEAERAEILSYLVEHS